MEKPVTQLQEFGADVARELAELSPERELAIERARRVFLEAPLPEPSQRRWFTWGALAFAAIVFQSPIYPMAFGIVVLGVYALLRAISSSAAQYFSKVPYCARYSLRF